MREADESVTNPLRSFRSPAYERRFVARARLGRFRVGRFRVGGFRVSGAWDGLDAEGRYARGMRVLVVAVCSWLALVATAAADDVPTCGAVSSLPVLDRYDALVPGARVRLALRWDAASQSWQPATRLAMPLHHASALEYVRWTAPAASADTIEVELEAIERLSNGVRHGTFFFTYRVRVLSACVRR